MRIEMTPLPCLLIVFDLTLMQFDDRMTSQKSPLMQSTLKPEQSIHTCWLSTHEAQRMAWRRSTRRHGPLRQRH
jgi:hypothetical protein